ncbi:MAG TPA: hypothetical protein VE987_08335 [Polyangiaceae bacterium]|nr:hypothetical protein [Polyangiaceae bacterium]
MIAQPNGLTERASGERHLALALRLARALQSALDQAADGMPAGDRQELRIAQAIAGSLGDRLETLADHRAVAKASRS